MMIGRFLTYAKRIFQATNNNGGDNSPCHNHFNCYMRTNRLSDKVVFFHKIGFAIFGVLIVALLFGCRATKKVTEKTEIKTEIATTEKKDLQSEWERFIKNNLNITLEGVEIEFEPPLFLQGADTCAEGDTLSRAKGEPILGFLKGNDVSVGDGFAKTSFDFSSYGNTATRPKVKMRIGRATIASNTEQVEAAKSNEVVETASEVKRDEKTDKHEDVKNPQSENLNAIKWIVCLGIVILLIFIFAKWLRKIGKI